MQERSIPQNLAFYVSHDVGTLAAQLAECHPTQGVDLLFYGDSITENWRGTSVGRPYPGGQGMPAVYQKHFGGYKSAVLAIAGEQHQPALSAVQYIMSTT